MTPRDTVAALRRGDIKWPAILKAVGTLALALLVAAGFGFRTPAQKFAEQDAKNAQQDTAIAAVAATAAALSDTLRSGQRKTNENFELTFRLYCLDPHLTQRDRQLAGLNCAALLQEAPARQAGTPR